MMLADALQNPLGEIIVHRKFFGILHQLHKVGCNLSVGVEFDVGDFFQDLMQLVTNSHLLQFVLLVSDQKTCFPLE